MLIRAKYHWSALLNAGFMLVAADWTERTKSDHFMVPFYIGVASFMLLFWSTTYTTFSNGVLTSRVFLIPFGRFAVGEIERVQPHKNNGKWGNGTVVVIWSKSGRKLTLQPNDPEPFLSMLRQQAPQAEFLL
jgi:hypothetical protein